MKKMCVEEGQLTERQWRKKKDSGEGGAQKRETKENEDRRAVCLCWIISVGKRLCDPAVDSGLS